MLHFGHNPRIRAHAGEVASSSPGGRNFRMCGPASAWMRRQVEM